MSAPWLLLTIDVEEDMPHWRISSPETVHNVAALPRLAELCERLGVRPTYLCTYPVATQPESAAILKMLYERGGCEIGSHLHPWNTPPFLGLPGCDGADERERLFYQSQLGPERFRKKLARLHEAVGELTGTAPVSYRAGRFGIDGPTLNEIIGMGYEVDSSVTPLESHHLDDGPDFRDAPQHPYRPAIEDVAIPGELPIVEIPLSVGLTRHLPRLLVRTYVRLPPGMRLRGLLSKDYLRWIDFAWLYPARFEADLMCRAARILVEQGAPVLNVFCHSSELVAGASGRVHTRGDVERCFQRIRGILEHCLAEYGARPATLTEAGRHLRPTLGF